LPENAPFLHVDAAQSFAKDLVPLQNKRIDLISLSGHKLYSPQGIGALIARKQRKVSRALSPLFFGGGQERGLRPGTLPVSLIVCFGEAARLISSENKLWHKSCLNTQQQIESCLKEVGAEIIGEDAVRLPNTTNFRVRDLDAEVVISALRDVISISNGSSCTSDGIKPSHVIHAITRDEQKASAACRASWCHMTPDLPYPAIKEALKSL
jgi:cysteine desulfurase